MIEKTKKSHDRECALADIPYIIREDGFKGCIWCGDTLKTNHHLQRYCKDKLCPNSAYIWGYPQRSESLIYLSTGNIFGVNFGKQLKTYDDKITLLQKRLQHQGIKPNSSKR